ncbi:MAG TPA: hypothetical protein PK514_12130 [Spirochaetota bacterium]|nr:hypothetical protein [Spirochaetota bacterium]
MKRLIFLLLPLFLLNCSTWYQITKKESRYYTDEEKQILEVTTAAVDFRYGFDQSLELDYVYKAGTFSEKELDDKNKKMLEVLRKIEKPRVVAFYEKMFRLKEIIAWNMNHALQDKEWGDYTLISKYILPDTEKYVEMLEKNVILIDQNYKTTIQERKGEIKKQVELELGN